MKKCPHCNGSLMLLRKESTVENAVFRTDSHSICKTCRRGSVDTQVWIRVCGVPLNLEDAQRPATAGGCDMRWYQPDRQVPPAINPTDANGNYRPEYVEWLRELPVQDWDDIRNCLEVGAYDYAEWDGDKDGFIIRLYADKKDDGDGFNYIFSVTTNVYDDDEGWWDVESADMPTEYWHLVQACAFMWQSDPTEWSLESY